MLKNWAPLIKSQRRQKSVTPRRSSHSETFQSPGWQNSAPCAASSRWKMKINNDNTICTCTFGYGSISEEFGIVFSFFLPQQKGSRGTLGKVQLWIHPASSNGSWGSWGLWYLEPSASRNCMKTVKNWINVELNVEVSIKVNKSYI